MTIVSLEIGNFRCFERAEIQFDPQCTVISGANAEGKTTILEALHVLSTGRSFRTTRVEQLIRDQKSDFALVGKIKDGTRQIALGVRWGTHSRELRFDGAKVKGFVANAASLPIRVIDPSGHRLVEEGPSQRRRFIDWGVFHVEQRFQSAWSAYSAALAQRNAALKNQHSRALVASWDESLARNGDAIGVMRSEYVAALAPHVSALSADLLGETVGLRLRSGWEAGSTLSSELSTHWTRDVRLRTTTVGPHRAELEISLKGVPAKERISRGQQKLLACVLVLGQLRLHRALGHASGTLLLDDPAAELDVDNLGKLMRIVGDLRVQVVATAVDPQTVEVMGPGKRFHVEQGQIAPMV